MHLVVSCCLSLSLSSITKLIASLALLTRRLNCCPSDDPSHLLLHSVFVQILNLHCLLYGAVMKCIQLTSTGLQLTLYVLL